MSSPPSRHAHGRSEIWERVPIKRAVRAERERLGATLRKLRKDRRLSLEQAAEEIGIHSKHLQRVELGTANVTLATLVAVSLAYRVPLAKLFKKAA